MAAPAHPPCLSHTVHLHHFGVRPFPLPLPLPCSRASLHRCVSRDEIRASFTQLERVLTSSPQYVEALCELIQDDLAFTSRELLSTSPSSSSSPSASPSPFTDVFLAYGLGAHVKQLLHRYHEQTTHNKDTPPAHPKKSQFPLDAWRVWATVRDVLAWTVAVWGRVGWAAQGTVLEAVSHLLRKDELPASAPHPSLWFRLKGDAIRDMWPDGRGDEDAREEDAQQQRGAAGALLGRAPGAASPLHVKRRKPLGPPHGPWGGERGGLRGPVSDAFDEEEEDADSDHAVGCSEEDEEEEEMEEDEEGAPLRPSTAQLFQSLTTPRGPRIAHAHDDDAVDEKDADAIAAGDAQSDEESGDEDAEQWPDAFGQRKDPAWLRKKLAGELHTIASPSTPPPLPDLAWPVPLPDIVPPPPSSPKASEDDVPSDSMSPLLLRRLRKASASAPAFTLDVLQSHLAQLPPARGFHDWCHSDHVNAWHLELVNFFGHEGGFALILSAVPSAPSTLFSFFTTPPGPLIATTPMLTAEEHAAGLQMARPPLQNLNHLMNFVDWVIMPRLRQPVAMALYLLLIPRMVYYLLTMPDAQLQRESKSILSEVVSRIAILTSHGSVQAIISLLPHLERFETDLSLHLLRCASLEKRIHGLIHLKKFVESAQPPSPSSSPTQRPLMDHFSMMPRPTASAFLSLPDYAAYLQRAGIIETLFGDNLHVQLLRRSVYLLRIMSQFQCVSPAQVELMWNASRGKHETVSSQVHACLMVVVGYLGQEGLNHLLERLKAVPIMEMDVHVITLVRAVVWAALGGARAEDEGEGDRVRFVGGKDGTVEEDEEERRLELSVSRRGLEFLWTQFNSKAPAANPLRNDVFHHLKSLLMSSTTARLRPLFMLRCVENLRQKWNVPCSLWLLHDLLETFAPSSSSASATLPASPFKMFMAQSVSALTTSPAFGAVVGGTPARRGVAFGVVEDERSKVIEWLNHGNRLINAFFREIALFSSQIAPSLTSSSSSSSSSFSAVLSLSASPGTFPSLAKQFDLRLMFLNYLYMHCPSIRFNYDSMQVLWSHFISPLPPPGSSPSSSSQPRRSSSLLSDTTQFDPEARDILFCFLQSIFNSPLTDAALAPLVFSQLVPLLPFASLSGAGFSFFQLLFTSINHAQRQLVVTATGNPPAFSVCVAPSSLSGFDWLWEIACTAVQEDVSVEAMRLLQRLHTQVEMEALSGMNDSYELCIGKAMERIGRLTEELHTTGDAHTAHVDRLNMEIERCFNILNLFFDQPHYPQTPVIRSPPARPSSTTSSSLSSPSPGPSAPASPLAPLTVWPRFPADKPGGLLYLAEDVVKTVPTLHEATLVEVSISYPREYGATVQYEVLTARVHSHATVDELLVHITLLSMQQANLVAVSHAVPFPFPMMQIWRDGDAAPLTLEQRALRLESLVKTGQAELDVRIAITNAPGGANSAACGVLGCSGVMPLWVSVCHKCKSAQQTLRREDLIDSRERIERSVWFRAHNSAFGGQPQTQAQEQPLHASDRQMGFDTPGGVNAAQGHGVVAAYMAALVAQQHEEKPMGLSKLAVMLTSEGYPLNRASAHWPSYEARREAWKKENIAAADKDKDRDKSAGSSASGSNKSLTIVLRKDKADGFSAGEKHDDAPDAVTDDAHAQRMEDVDPADSARTRKNGAAVVVVHPSAILSRPEYFDQLFDLLSFARSNTGLAEKCWQLLMRLGDQGNERMMTRLLTLTTPAALSSPVKGARPTHASTVSASSSTSSFAALSVDDEELQWDVLLDPHNLAKLQYSLMIVQTLIKKGNKKADVPSHTGEGAVRPDLRVDVEPGTPFAEARSLQPAVRDGSEWERRFVAKGGLRHLLRILLVNDFVLSSIPLPAEPALSASPPAPPPSFHQSLALQCLTTLIETITTLIPLTLPPSPPTPPPSTSPVESPPADARTADDDADMSTQHKKRKAGDPSDAEQPGLKRIKSMDMTASRVPLVNSPPPSPPEPLFSVELMHQLLRLLLHCAQLPLYQPASSSTSPASRSLDSILSTLAVMDHQIAEGAASLAKLIPAVPSAVSAVASPFPVDSPGGPSQAFIGPAALSLPSPSSASSNSSFPAFFAPPVDSHRDEVTAAFFQLSGLFCIGLSSLPEASRSSFLTHDVFYSLLHTCLLSSPRLCIRQTTDVTLARFFTSLYSAVPDGRTLVGRLFCALVDLLLTTPLSALQQRYRHQTENVFALILRILSGCLQSRGGMDFNPTRSAGPAHLHALSLCERLFSLLMAVQTEQESDGVPDQTVLGLLWLCFSVVKTQSRHDQDASASDGLPNGQSNGARHMGKSELSELVSSTGLVHFLYAHGLFDVLPVHTAADLVQSTSFPPLFRFTATRFACFELLQALAATSASTYMLLLHLSMRSHPPRSDLTQLAQYNYQPALQKKPASIPYVGLHNLGATCYMNSLMQQLFFTPPLRYGLFVQRSTERLQRSDKEAGESLLYQLQLLMGMLQESVQKFYDARSFCGAYRDYENQCMQVGVQMDVNEFANILFDQVERELKAAHSPQAALLQHVYGGKVTNQLICQVCGSRNERDEEYFMLSLDVKNQHSITNSLSMYTEGELLQGDNKATCTRCERKCDTLKRVCVRTLPPHLILHLKRFEFDLDSMRKYKVNDYVEFPMELDLFPYTKEGLEQKERDDKHKDQGGGPEKTVEAAPAEDEEKEENGVAATASEPTPIQPSSYYRFELTGVLVHTGTCNSGHYYSFVKETVVAGTSGTSPPPGPARWFSCNDTNVELLNVDSLKDACFGGGEVVQNYDHVTRKTVSNFVPKTYSAYMLFYQRVDVPTAPPAPSSSASPNAVDGKDDRMQTDEQSVVAGTVVEREALSASPPSALPDVLPPSAASSLVPPLIFQSIWEANTQFLRDCFIFDAHYFQFLWKQVRGGLSWWLDADRQHDADKARLKAAWEQEDDALAYAGKLDQDEQLTLLPAPSSPFIPFTGHLPLYHGDDVLYHAGKLAIHFLLHTYSHAKMKGSIDAWDVVLKQMIDESPRLAHYLLSLLSTHREYMNDLFLLSSQPQFRSRWNDIVLAAINTLTARYHAAYRRALDAAASTKAAVPRPTLHPTVVDYMRVYLSFLPAELQEYLKNSQTYFQFLVSFINAHPSYLAFVMHIPGLITTLLQFFVSTDSPADCPVTGVSRSLHETSSSLTASGAPITAVNETVRVLMFDGTTKPAKSICVGDVLVSERGEERRVLDVIAWSDQEGDEDEEVDPEIVWRAFVVEGGIDYLLHDLSVVRNEEGATIGERREEDRAKYDNENWSSDEEDEDEDEALADADSDKPIPELDYHTSPPYPGIPRSRIPPTPPRSLDKLFVSLRKMRTNRKKWSEKLKPFATFLVQLLAHGWAAHPQSTAFFPFLPYREGRLLCHTDVYSALCEIDASLPDRTFYHLCRNVYSSVHVVSVQLTEEINKTACGGLAHLFVLLYHFLAIQDAHVALRVRTAIKKLVIVIRRNEKYEKEYPAMLHHLAGWFEPLPSGEDVMDEHVQLVVREELIQAVMSWAPQPYPICVEARENRIGAGRLLVALGLWETKEEQARRQEELDRWLRNKEQKEGSADSKESAPPSASDAEMDTSGVKADPSSPSTAAVPAVSGTSELACQRLFVHLLDLLPNCTLALLQRFHDKQAFAELFSVLSTLLSHHNPLVALVTPVHVQALLELMEHTSKTQIARDPTKQHTIAFLYQILVLVPSYRTLLTHSPALGLRGAEALANVHMFHDASAANLAYNEDSLSQLFTLVLWACEQSPEFVASLQHNVVFDWAVSLLYMQNGDMYPRCGARVRAVMDRLSRGEEGGEWRRKHINKLWARGTAARPSEAKAVEVAVGNRTAAYVEIMKALMVSNDDVKLVCGTWFLQSLALTLDRAWLQLPIKVHEDAIDLFHRAFLWYTHVQDVKDNASAAVFDKLTMTTTTQKHLCQYLANVSSALKVLKPQPLSTPPTAASITAAAPSTLQKAVTRSAVKAGAQQTPAKATKSFVPRLVLASSLSLSSRDLQGMEPLERLSARAQAQVGEVYSMLCTMDASLAVSILIVVGRVHSEQVQVDLAANESFQSFRSGQIMATEQRLDVQDAIDADWVGLGSVLPAPYYEALLPVFDDAFFDEYDEEALLLSIVETLLIVILEVVQALPTDHAAAMAARLLPISPSQAPDDRRVRLIPTPWSASSFEWSFTLLLALMDALHTVVGQRAAVGPFVYKHRQHALLLRLFIARHPAMLAHHPVASVIRQFYATYRSSAGNGGEDLDRLIDRACQQALEGRRWRELLGLVLLVEDALAVEGAEPPVSAAAVEEKKADNDPVEGSADAISRAQHGWMQRWLMAARRYRASLDLVDRHRAAKADSADSDELKADAHNGVADKDEVKEAESDGWLHSAPTAELLKALEVELAEVRARSKALMAEEGDATTEDLIGEPRRAG